jgi:hypothetical protein
MKKCIWIATALLMTAGILLAGCSAASVQGSAAGFYSPDKIIKGGKTSDTLNINVKEIKTSKQGEDTVIDITLLYGSRLSQKDEARISYLPTYEVSCLGMPHRLAVKLSDIYFFDYTDSFDMAAIQKGLVQGVFYKIGSSDNETLDADDTQNTAAAQSTDGTDLFDEAGGFELYFNISQSASFKVEETEDSLKITLHPQGAEKQKGFFATLDAFDDYQEGYLPADSGFTPTLCKDYENRILISDRFAGKEEAENFKKTAQQKLGSYIIGKFIRIVEQSTGELPEYTTALTADELKTIPVIKTGNTEHTLDMLITDGSYLATAPNGTVLFMRKYQEDSVDDSKEEDADMEEEPVDPIFQRLWVQDAGGSVQALGEAPDFSDIRKVAYSPSGKFIAIMDVGTNNVTLYVYDVATKNTYNMGEEGLGDTDDFTWTTDKDTLYSISGTEESKQLMVCDFSKADHTPQALEEQGIGFGKLELGGGKLYFTDEGEEKIYQYDFATGERKHLTDGPGFVISPDGRYMAYFKPAPEVAEQPQEDTAVPASATNSQPSVDETDSTDEQDAYIGDLRDFVLRDLTTGKETMIVKETQIDKSACSFSADGKKIFFININAETTESDESLYINPFFVYDIASGKLQMLFKTVSESFYTTKDPNKLYLVNSLLVGESGLDVTYICDLTKKY